MIKDGNKKYDHILYLRINEACNLYCEHCFIPSNPKRMNLEQIKNVPQLVSNFAQPNDVILVQWHGGEPTVSPPEFMEQAFELFSQQTDFKFVHEIQTNLMNYDKFKNIFKQYFNSKIGVSWDPVIRRTKKNDVESYKEFNEKFWGNIEKALSDGIEIYLIITLTKKLILEYKNPLDLLFLLSNRGITHLHFEKLTPSGNAKENWSQIGVSNKEYSDYMSKMYDAYLLWNSNEFNSPIYISPFDGLKNSVLNLSDKASSYGCWSGACDTRFHTIDANGYQSGCTALTSNGSAQNEKGVSIISINDILKERKNRQANCKNCKFNKICSTGCLETPMIDGSGECSGNYLLFENILKKVEMKNEIK